jgi:hypothetical protein
VLSTLPPAGVEPATYGLGNRTGNSVKLDSTNTSANPPKNLAECLALLAQNSPALALVAECWNGLPDPVRAGIVAMVKAARSGANEMR